MAGPTTAITTRAPTLPQASERYDRLNEDGLRRELESTLTDLVAAVQALDARLKALGG